MARSKAIQEAVALAADEYRSWQQNAIGRDIDPGKLVQLVMEAGAGRVDMTTLKPAAFSALSRSQVGQCAGFGITFKGYKDI